MLGLAETHIVSGYAGAVISDFPLASILRRRYNPKINSSAIVWRCAGTDLLE
jgi:hypothetical protein